MLGSTRETLKIRVQTNICHFGIGVTTFMAYALPTLSDMSAPIGHASRRRRFSAIVTVSVDDFNDQIVLVMIILPEMQ